MKKLLHYEGKSQAIYFPPKISCDFMTNKCKKECVLKPNDWEKAIYNYMVDNPIETIIKKIIGEFNTSVLTWFLAGDCPSNQTDKISSIIKMLHEKGVVQTGFTRNKMLWNRVKSYTKFALTVEDMAEVKKLRKEGFVSFPQYDSEVAKIYSPTKEILCGGGYVTCGQGFVKEEDYTEEDCGICYEKGVGCFN